MFLLELAEHNSLSLRHSLNYFHCLLNEWMKLMLNTFIYLKIFSPEGKLGCCYNVVVCRKGENRPEKESIFALSINLPFQRLNIWQWSQHTGHRLCLVVSVFNNWMNLKICYQKQSWSIYAGRFKYNQLKDWIYC